MFEIKAEFAANAVARYMSGVKSLTMSKSGTVVGFCLTFKYCIDSQWNRQRHKTDKLSNQPKRVIA